MKLRRYRVKEFRSIWDSGTIEVDDQQTCLVGKNEAGKTALLEALYKTNPIIPAKAGYNLTFDYPRREVEDYRLEREQGRRESTVVVRCDYELADEDRQAVVDVLGPGALQSRTLAHEVFYDNPKGRLSVETDDLAAMGFLAGSSDLPQSVVESLANVRSWAEFHQVLLDKVEVVEGSTDRLDSIVSGALSSGLGKYVAEEILRPRMPKFMYFDDYYLMRGRENLNALVDRERSGNLVESDRPLLGLMHLARLDHSSMLDVNSTQELKNRLEGASNFLTRRIAKYWSQNRHIQMRFDVREGRPEDPEGMQDGVNLWGEIYDSVHWTTTSIEARSRGFRWFFSFLAWHEQIRREGHQVILLLDEPGLSLHGSAQGDLLRFFEEELSSTHQVIYSTHSPFMVDPKRLDRVRIVQDLGIDSTNELPKDLDGTKVLRHVHEATEESLFPLHGALGFDIHQTLFVGPNSLVVEGVADVLFLTAMSDALTREGRTGLSQDWVIVPAGGIGKVSTFVSLFGSQKGMTIAVLLDVDMGSRESVEDLYRKKLLHKKHVHTYADFVHGPTRSADIEDMFDRGFYVELVNREYGEELGGDPITADALNDREPRVVRAIGEYLKGHPMKSGAFSHYRPARYLNEHVGELWGEISEGTKRRFEDVFSELNGALKS